MKNTPSPTLKKIGFATFIMMASVFASRVIGLVRESVIAFQAGAGAGVDAYQVAFVIPEILNHVVASGFMSITFIPILARYLNQDREKEGFHIFSIIFNGFGILLLVFIAITTIWAPFFVNLFAPGITDPATFDLAVKMTRIIIPAQFFFFSGGLFSAVQFVRERFFIPALAPLIYNIGIIAGGVFLYPRLGMEGFAWGVLGGAFAGNFALQWVGAKKAGLKYSLALDLTHADLKKYILLTLPLMFGLTMTFSTEILLKFFGSYLDAGSIAAMNYALRIMFILVGFFGQAVGTASYPFMAKLAAKGEMEQLNALINQTMKFIFLVLPFSVLFMVLRREIVLVLFQRGQFDPQATQLTASVLPYFMAGAFAFAAQTIVSRGYFAMQNTLFPAIFSTICVLASCPVIYLLSQWMGVQGVALGLSLSVVTTTLLLYEAWNRKSGNMGKSAVYLFFLKLIPLSLIMGGICAALRHGLSQFISPTTLPAALGVGILTGMGFIIILPMLGRLMKIQEIKTLYQKISQRILPWQRKAKAQKQA
ncbi:MAG: murein biosynthesis integral membrane protein MurJ [Desulfobacterales bacterium]|nr:murein biosynthesis integral membrane protein MurJ [Desulfobacterales bacterium]